MPSVAIIFNVLPINCEDGFEMIYRIQGDKAISWPCTWERLERKRFYFGSHSGSCCYLRKGGKNLNFLPGLVLAGDGWEERWGLCWVGMLWGYSWVFVLCLSLCWDEGGPQWRRRGFGAVMLPHKPIHFPKSEPSPFWVRDAGNS